MESKKILVWLLAGMGMCCALVLLRLPAQANRSGRLEKVESQVYLPLVQQSTLLPRSLYYIDDAQIYRLDRNGITITQITFEVEGVNDFDVSPRDGKLAYSTGNQLILADANGANRQVLVSSDTEMLFFPHWAPNGQTLAYEKDDSVYFYDLASGISSLVLGNNGDGLNYSPRDFSPNGSYLVVFVSGSIPTNLGIYELASGTVSLLEPTEPDYEPYCSPFSWAIDSTYLYISSFYAAGDCSIPGLWRYTSEGDGIPLLPLRDDDGFFIFNKTAAPWQEITGDLVYLFSPPETGIDPLAPFSLVHSASDGVSNRVALRPETFHVSHLTHPLWTPTGSAVVIVQNNGETNHATNMIFVPVDSSLPIVTLLDDASTVGMSLHWGP